MAKLNLKLVLFSTPKKGAQRTKANRGTTFADYPVFRTGTRLPNQLGVNSLGVRPDQLRRQKPKIGNNPCRFELLNLGKRKP